MAEPKSTIPPNIARMLLACCIGSRAALAKLQQDRQSLTRDQLQQIIDRLDAVIAMEAAGS